MNSVVRRLEPLVREALEDTPVVVLQGARQVGKSTLAHAIAARVEALTFTLDDELTRRLVAHDPVAFVRQSPGSLMVIDEVQREPRLILAIKAAVDEDRRPGRFLLTGSANVLRLRGTGDSLAGRAESLTLYPFSASEVDMLHGKAVHSREDFISALVDEPEVVVAPGNAEELDPHAYAVRIVAGGFPEPLGRTVRSATRWFTSYSERLATHDAAQLSQGEFPAAMHSLLRVLAARPSSELVMSKIARAIEVSESTARTYTELLESMYLLHRTRGWGQGLLGRETRRAKVGLVDTGLASSLIDFTPEKAVRPSGFEYFGALTEQFVVNELFKQQEWSEKRFRVHHYRSRSAEVDVIVELADGTVIAIEVRSSSTVAPASWRHLERIRDELGERFRYGAVLHTGALAMPVADRIAVMPISRLWRH